MFDYGMLNVGSFILGLIAWIMPIVNLTRVNKDQENNAWVTLSILSISACGVALTFQIFYSYHLVKIEDWGALMDTMYAVAIASTILLIVTILLNVLTLFVYRNRSEKRDVL